MSKSLEKKKVTTNSKKVVKAKSEKVEKVKVNKIKKLTKKQFIIIGSIFAACILVATISISLLFDNKETETEVKNCLVQFNTNGGSEVEATSLECGGTINEPEVPYKSGFDFIGWYSDGKEYDFKSKVDSNIILEAKWKVKKGVKTVTIKFDTDGGSEQSDIIIEKGKYLTKPVNPTKNGYTFVGWYLEEKKFNFGDAINKDIILVAKWEKKKQQTTSSESNKDNSNNSQVIVGKCEYDLKERDENWFWHFYLGEKEYMGPSMGFYNWTDACEITYKSSDEKVLIIDSDGYITPKKLGKTNISICVSDIKTKKQLECSSFVAYVKYEVNSDRARTDGNNLVKAIDGYYWYLDGYEYAYIKADNIDWYGHKALDWTSKYIDLKNNKFVTTEDTGVVYNYSSEIHNTFLVNPSEEFAYSLIEDYNMHVSSDKLYITLGSKTYSFSKRSSEKIVKAKLSVDSSNLAVAKESFVSFFVNTSPTYASYELSVSSSDTSIISRCSVDDNFVTCWAAKTGDAVLTIKDINGSSVKVNVSVKKVSATGVTLNKSTIALERGSSETLKATVLPSNVANENVTWSSSDTSIATVSSSGKVTAKRKGTATITVTTDDGGYTAKCIVTVSNPTLTASGSIGVQTTSSSSGITKGVIAEVNASGGTGTYTYYYIKLYKDGTLIGSTTNTSSNEIFITGYTNGSYTMEYEVRDSDGTIKKGTSSSTISGF